MDITDNDLATMYENWITYVESKVPPNRLLIFNAKDGIESLATFCGQKVPGRKMPYANDTTKFNMRKNLIHGMALAIIFRKFHCVKSTLLGSDSLGTT